MKTKNRNWDIDLLQIYELENVRFLQSHFFKIFFKKYVTKIKKYAILLIS